nr:MAG TPA: hypothetical protein [Caudoviricetes sp.]
MHYQQTLLKLLVIKQIKQINQNIQAEVAFVQKVLVEVVLRLLHRHIIIILVSIIQLILMIQANLLLMIILTQINILIVSMHLKLLEMLDMEYLLGEVRLIIQWIKEMIH